MKKKIFFLSILCTTFSAGLLGLIHAEMCWGADINTPLADGVVPTPKSTQCPAGLTAEQNASDGIRALSLSTFPALFPSVPPKEEFPPFFLKTESSPVIDMDCPLPLGDVESLLQGSSARLDRCMDSAVANVVSKDHMPVGLNDISGLPASLMVVYQPWMKYDTPRGSQHYPSCQAMANYCHNLHENNSERAFLGRESAVSNEFSILSPYVPAALTFSELGIFSDAPSVPSCIQEQLLFCDKTRLDMPHGAPIAYVALVVYDGNRNLFEKPYKVLKYASATSSQDILKWGRTLNELAGWSIPEAPLYPSYTNPLQFLWM